MIGCCGDLYDECPRRIASLENDPVYLSDVLSLWVRAGMRNEGTRIGDILCTGCATVSSCRYQTVRNCVQK